MPNKLECFIDLKCEALSKSKNSRQKSSNGRSFNSVVTYTCNPPFKLRGSSTRTCRATGKWDGKKARCSEYLCSFKFFFKDDTFILSGQKEAKIGVTLSVSFHEYSLLKFLRSFVPSFVRSFVCSFVPPFLRPSVPLFLCSLLFLFLCAFDPSFLHKLALSFRNRVQGPRRNFVRKQTSRRRTSREVYSVLVF